MIHERRAALRLLRKSVACAVHGQLRAALNTWLELYFGVVAEREEAEQREARRLARAAALRPRPREYVELLDAKTCPDARRLHRKMDVVEERRFALIQEALKRAAEREAALKRMGFDDDE